ncbi:MAG: cupin-like domain-containing protein, partial [Pseudomonadota bacterium]
MVTVTERIHWQDNAKRVSEIDFSDETAFHPSAFVAKGRPTVLKGALAHHPMVVAGSTSSGAFQDYISSYYTDQRVLVYRAPAAENGRHFYDKTLSGFNFTTEQMSLHDVFELIQTAAKDPAHDTVYVGSTNIDQMFPGLSDQLPTSLREDASGEGRKALFNLWMGTRSLTACHYDATDNAALCVAGRRRFTLFPPDQIANLYPGPLAPTPGGQVVSMVDFDDPDFDRFPNFADAIDAARVADLEPGDLLIYPAMWWHQVQSVDTFNVLLNKWWNTQPAYSDSPQTTLLHALLSLRNLSQDEKQAWKAVF